MTSTYCCLLAHHKQRLNSNCDPSTVGNQSCHHACMCCMQVTFEPGLDNTNAPLGRWGALSFVVPTPYFSGTDTNGGSTPGVVVNNDIALVWVSPLNNRQIGDVTGWLGYGWDSFSFAAPAAGFGVPTVTGMPAMAQLTQFG